MTTRVILPNPVAVAKALLTDAAPSAEVTTAQAGMMDKGSRGDHKHPRLTSVTWGVLNASNEATITFTRTFADKPGLDCMYEELADNPPISFKIKSWIQDGGGNYTAVVLKAYRGQLLPSLSGILLIGPLITALSGFNIFGGSATGISFSCIAVQKS